MTEVVRSILIWRTNMILDTKQREHVWQLVMYGHYMQFRCSRCGSLDTIVTSNGQRTTYPPKFCTTDDDK